MSGSSAVLQYSGPALVGLLGSGGDVLPWVLMTVCLPWHLVI